MSVTPMLLVQPKAVKQPREICASSFGARSSVLSKVEAEVTETADARA